MKRRTALIGTAGVVATALAGGGGALWSKHAKDAWQMAVTRIRAPIVPHPADAASLRELVRYATLAANSHNTQPWRFSVTPSEITVRPDMARSTVTVDPDEHHLYVSLGAAAENIVQGAPLLGLVATARFEPDAEGRIVIGLATGDVIATPMANAIPKRRCTRSPYTAAVVPEAECESLAAVGRGDGVDVILLTDRRAIDAVGAFIIDGNTVQMNDHAFKQELKQWLRFSYADAVASGDGLFAATSGNPVIPSAVGRLLFELVATAKSENAKYLAQISSSAGLAIFVSEQNDRAHWVAAGRAYQRFALLATTLGIKHAFLNQAVEVSAVRQRLAQHLALGKRRPDLIVRFGYADEMPLSMRRPVAEVID